MMEQALPQKLEHYLPPKKRKERKKKHDVGKASTSNLCKVVFCGHLTLIN
jgi:hypothetical protein